MSIFGSSFGANKPAPFSGFGSTQTPNTGGIFGNQSNQQQNQNVGSSTSGLFAGFPSQGNQQNQQNQNQTQNQAPQPSNPNSVFGGFGGGMTGVGNLQQQPQQAYSWNQPQQPTQQQIDQARFLNESSQHLPSFLKSENGGGSRTCIAFLYSSFMPLLLTLETGPKDVKDQIDTIFNKWNTSSPECAFQYYFYNKVPEATAPFYRPAPDEDEKKWEEALSKKPGPGYIPVLCIGFSGLAERMKTQQRNLIEFNNRLHEINRSLDFMLHEHDMKSSIRIMEAKRKHIVLKTRCMALARKVQVLRNRGYALSNEEEVVRQKLDELEKKVMDPGLAARGEEIWARMLGVKSRADSLKEQLNKSAKDGVDGNGLDEEMMKKANKVSLLSVLFRTFRRGQTNIRTGSSRLYDSVGSSENRDDCYLR